MSEDVDKSLLDRLQALRGNAASSSAPTTQPAKIGIDVIERKKTPTREDTLASRLKSLRDGAASSPASSSPKQHADTPPRPSAPAKQTTPLPRAASADVPAKQSHGDEAEDAIFETDDQTLEELLADVTPDESQSRPDEPSDAQVKALLEQLSKEVPQDGVGTTEDKDEVEDSDSDNSDGEAMNRKANEVLERFHDEAEVEASRPKKASDGRSTNSDDDSDGNNGDGSSNSNSRNKIYDNNDGDGNDGSDTQNTSTPADIDMPSVPSNLEDLPTPGNEAPKPKPKTVDDIAARMAALRAPSHDEDDEGGDSLKLPSVPRSRPAGKPVKRLTSRTNYTDDDVDSWCTVCLEDATLRCLGCDDDVYCTRCWKEMHVGPASAFDDRTHRAVHFTRDKKKEKPDKVALGA